MILVLATQRPDAKSLPTGVSSNVSLRFCLKVMDQIANDMVLGTSAYKKGIRATTFRRRGRRRARLPGRRRGVSRRSSARTTWTWPRPSRSPSGPGRCARPRARCPASALGEDDSAPQRDVLADAAEALAGATGMHWQALADQLAERFPERWADATGDAVRAELGARGVPSVVVVMDGTRARGCRAADVDKAASGT